MICWNCHRRWAVVICEHCEIKNQSTPKVCAECRQNHMIGWAETLPAFEVVVYRTEIEKGSFVGRAHRLVNGGMKVPVMSIFLAPHAEDDVLDTILKRLESGRMNATIF